MVSYSTTSLTEWRHLSTCVRQSIIVTATAHPCYSFPSMRVVCLPLSVKAYWHVARDATTFNLWNLFVSFHGSPPLLTWNLGHIIVAKPWQRFPRFLTPRERTSRCKKKAQAVRPLLTEWNNTKLFGQLSSDGQPTRGGSHWRFGRGFTTPHCKKMRLCCGVSGTQTDCLAQP
jgi:hypothetical protein